MSNKKCLLLIALLLAATLQGCAALLMAEADSLCRGLSWNKTEAQVEACKRGYAQSAMNPPRARYSRTICRSYTYSNIPGSIHCYTIP